MKKLLLVSIMTLMLMFPATACTLPGSGSNNEGTIDVVIYKAGFGVEWLEKMGAEFEKMYADEGYKINVVNSSNAIAADAVATEIKLTTKNTNDLYFIGGVNVTPLITASKASLKGDVTKVLLEDLSDVYDKPAIGLNKVEETVNVKDKMRSELHKYYQFHGTADPALDKWKDNFYLFPWGMAPAGLFVNTAVLNKYTLEIPRTTNELKSQFDTIIGSGAADEYPVTFAGSKAPGYWMYMSDTLFAQYSGVEAYNNFYATMPDSGDIKNDGWQVYEDQGILESLKSIDTILKPKYMADGTSDLTHTSAQFQVMSGKAAYIVTGSWVYNEMKVNYADHVGNIQMIKMPVISALGTKLSISDSQLSTAVGLVDDGKTDAEVALGAGITEAKAVEIRRARGVYFDAGLDHTAMIPSYSPSKEAAKLFLRFLASNDGMRIYRQSANSSLPFGYVPAANEQTTDFVKSVDAVASTQISTMVREDMYSSLIRSTGGKLRAYCAFPGAPDLFNGIFKSTVGYTAQEIYDLNLEYARENWDFFCTQSKIV